MAHPHHPVGQARTELLHPDQPSAGFQLCVELLEITLGQLVQLDLSDLRNDVLVDPFLVTELGIQPELGFAVVLIPEVQPVAEGHVRPALRHRRSALLPKLLQLLQALGLSSGKNIFRLRLPVVIADDHTAFPSAVGTLSHRAGSVLSFLSHGSSLHDLVQETSHHARCLALHVRGDMGVGVQGEGCVGVPQDAGQGLGIHAAGQGMGGEGMPQVVETDRRKLRISEQGLQPTVRRAGGHGQLRLGGVAEDPVAVGFLLPGFQKLRCAGRELDGSCAGFRFRLADLHAAALTAGDRPADLQPSRPCIEVRPPQTADLTPAQAGGQLRVEEVVPDFILPHHLQEFFQLGFRQDLFRCVVGLGDHRALGGVLHDQPLPHRRVHGLMQEHVDGADHAVGEGVAFFVMLIDPPVRTKPVVHLLDVSRGNGADLPVPQMGLDVIVRHPAVAVQGTLPNGELHVLVQPFVQPCSEGQIGAFRQLHVPVGFDAGVELVDQLLLGSGEDTAEDGTAVLLVSHHDPALPAAVASLTYQTVAVWSFLCHDASLLS